MGGFSDDDILDGDIVEAIVGFGGSCFDFFDYVHAENNFAKDSILGGVEGGVVLGIDEKLGVGTVEVTLSGHCDSTFFIENVQRGFVDDIGIGLFKVGDTFIAATLNHEVGDDAVENGIVVEAIVDVFEEIFDGFGAFLFIEFDDDFAHIGVKFDDGVAGDARCGNYETCKEDA